MHHEECLGIKVLRIHVILFLPHLLQLVLGHGMLQFIMLSVLGLQLLHLLLNNLPFLSIIDSIQSHLFLKLLLHLIFLEVLSPLLVLLLQVCSGLLDQLLQILHIKLGRLDIKMLRYLEMLLVHSIAQFKLFLSQVSQPLQLLSLYLVQLSPHSMTEKLKLLSDGSISDLIRLGGLQLLPELWITLQDLHHLLQILVVLQTQVPLLRLILLRSLTHGWTNYTLYEDC